MECYTVQTADGWNLAVRCLEGPAGPRRGSVLMLPAMMVDSRTLDKPAGDGLATTIARHGFRVHIADFRGHGGSGPAVQDGGSWAYDDLVLHDVPALIDAVADRDGGPIWVVGHSLGGHVALAACTAARSRQLPIGHVLLAANIWMPSLEGSRRRRLRKHLAMVAFRSGAAAFGRWPSRRLRMGNVDEAQPYVEDLAGFWFEDRWSSADDRHDYLAGLTSVRGPALFVAGAGDTLMGHVEGARAFAEQLGPGRATFWFARKGEHGLGWDPHHMGLVTDARSRPLWRRIARWMEQRTPA